MKSFEELGLSKDTLKEEIPIVLQLDSLNTFIAFDSLEHPYILGKKRIEFWTLPPTLRVFCARASSGLIVLILNLINPRYYY